MPPEHTASAVTTAQARALEALTSLPAYPARRCAPAPGNPAVCAYDRTTPTSLWMTPDQESRAARHAREQRAKLVCAGCPVRSECYQYALEFEEWNVWGGTTRAQRARERRRLHTAATVRTTPPDPTTQRAAVLRALAAHYSPAAVAAAAGVDERTAAWQRARLVTLLHLDPKRATRMDLLHAARTAGLLDPRLPLLTNRGRIVAAIPGEQRNVERAHPRPRQLLLPDPETAPAPPVPLHTTAPVDALGVAA